ncbi:hypothetical protein MHYP_G00011730 [Metynnis hypsauchen]
MSRLSLMIFTLVIMTTILCNHSVHSRKRLSRPFKCMLHRGNFHKIIRYSDIPQHKQDVRQCLCWKKYDGEIVGHCRGRIDIFRIPTPV